MTIRRPLRPRAIPTCFEAFDPRTRPLSEAVLHGLAATQARPPFGLLAVVDVGGIAARVTLTDQPAASDHKGRHNYNLSKVARFEQEQISQENNDTQSE